MTELDARILDRLYATIKARGAAGDTDNSWTAQLLAGAPDLPCDKLLEEAAELAGEVRDENSDDAAVIHEAGDLLYHFLVVLAARGIAPRDIWAELQKREAQSGIAEKAARGQ